MTRKVLKGHTKWVFCLNYNQQSNLLVSGGCEGDVRIWNVARGPPLSLVFHDNLTNAILPSPSWDTRQERENDSCSHRLCYGRSF